jgi:hypothetical protein
MTGENVCNSLGYGGLGIKESWVGSTHASRPWQGQLPVLKDNIVGAAFDNMVNIKTAMVTMCFF